MHLAVAFGRMKAQSAQEEIANAIATVILILKIPLRKHTTKHI